MNKILSLNSKIDCYYCITESSNYAHTNDQNTCIPVAASISPINMSVVFDAIQSTQSPIFENLNLDPELVYC